MTAWRREQKRLKAAHKLLSRMGFVPCTWVSSDACLWIEADGPKGRPFRFFNDSLHEDSVFSLRGLPKAVLEGIDRERAARKAVVR
jgi:hypothetical protein